MLDYDSKVLMSIILCHIFLDVPALVLKQLFSKTEVDIFVSNFCPHFIINSFTNTIKFDNEQTST